MSIFAAFLHHLTLTTRPEESHPQARSVKPLPAEFVPSAMDRLILGDTWAEALSAARSDVYGRPVGGGQ